MLKPLVPQVAKKNLVVKRSKLPAAGKGLFTKQAIKKGAVIVEYKGALTTWKKILSYPGFNGYVFYINRNNVIDAKRRFTALGRYANDAKGPGKMHGMVNNSHYITRGKQVYIQATRNIPAGGEILVSYGKEYWDVVKYNHAVSEQHKKLSKKKLP